MNSLLIQTVALTTSLLLAIPAGWCSGWMDAGAHSPGQTACCQATDPHDPVDSPATPSTPTAECCCSWDATLSSSSVRSDDLSNLPLSHVVAGFADVGSTRASAQVVVPLQFGPRLHVLKCVWRC